MTKERLTMLLHGLTRELTLPGTAFGLRQVRDALLTVTARDGEYSRILARPGLVRLRIFHQERPEDRREPTEEELEEARPLACLLSPEVTACFEQTETGRCYRDAEYLPAEAAGIVPQLLDHLAAHGGLSSLSAALFLCGQDVAYWSDYLDKESPWLSMWRPISDREELNLDPAHPTNKATLEGTGCLQLLPRLSTLLQHAREAREARP